ncbi:protoporphyrinogen oxidase [Streptomonospora nanhaiensis]|uniref:Coproporphyrinogen III oxidase n=1 Tax=Streptomonospora nanhaiensis TaxID=1323731 RepID=A0A853BF30_9ACTN|nr:protoporphyrinogen oxidase [Streptomonospora nanhaiensis]MBV2366144.1 protoporphyrinogen oxidase [Streptomonospora nanhaiensis]NYI93879.1 oxygen-dependent protoporphyrinogen oxidase [Streptomonospora nanhaiensis]
MQRQPHVVVVGAGVSGLTAAHRLTRSGARVTVLEAAPRIGGKLHATPFAGVPVDAGAESVLARRPEALDLIAELGLSDRLVHPAPVPASLYSRGRLRPFPATQVMGVPGDLADLARSGVLSPLGTLRAGLDLVLPPTPLRGDVSVAGHIGARMGREVVDRLVEPMLGGVYAGRAERLSLEATLPQIAQAARRERSLLRAVGRTARRRRREREGVPGGPVFAGLRGGISVLVGELARQCGADVQTSATVRALAQTARGWRLTVGAAAPDAPRQAPREIAADGVVLACPAPAAARLLGEAAPEAARDLAGVEYASMAIVTLAYPAAAFARPPRRSGFLVSSREGLAIKAATFSSVKWPWLDEELRAAHPGEDTVVVRCSIGRAGETALLQRGDDELAALAAADLARVCGVAGAPVQSRVTRWGGGLPQYDVGHTARVARVRAEAARHPGLALCGAAYDGVGIPACIAGATGAAAGLAAALPGIGERGAAAPAPTTHDHTDQTRSHP